MKSYEYIEDPIVGKFYDVPCVPLHNFPDTFVAVLPNFHSDKGLGVDAEHYHYDLRFFTKVERQKLTGDFEASVTQHIAVPTKFEEYHPTRKFEVKILKKKCTSVYTGIESGEGKLRPTQEDWFLRQIGKSCKGKVCPHLGEKMIEIGEQLICPYHGLVGDSKTEIIIGNVHGVDTETAFKLPEDER